MIDIKNNFKFSIQKCILFLRCLIIFKHKFIFQAIIMTNNKELSDHLKCKLCNNTYEDPIILPCYKTICSKHVFSETIGDVFKCSLCNNGHAITIDGFPKNEDIYNLVNVSKDYIHLDLALSSNNQKAKDLCKDLEQIISKLELLENDPVCFIYDYFGKIKSDLDLSRENKIKMIDDQYSKLLKEIEDAENECKSSANKFDFSSELKNQIDTATENLSEYLDLSNETKIIDDSEWNYLQFQIEKVILLSEHSLKKFESKFLNNKKYEFKANKSIGDINLGELLKLHDTLPDEDRLNATIKFKLDDIISFRHNNHKMIKSFDIINNLPWIITATVYTDNEYDNILLIVVEALFIKGPEISMDANLELKVLESDGTICEKISFEPEFHYFQWHEPICIFRINITELKNENYHAFKLIKDFAYFQLDIFVENT